jgi:hypothetical protein
MTDLIIAMEEEDQDHRNEFIVSLYKWLQFLVWCLSYALMQVKNNVQPRFHKIKNEPADTRNPSSASDAKKEPRSPSKPVKRVPTKSSKYDRKKQ